MKRKDPFFLNKNCLLLALMLLPVMQVYAQEDIDVGETGWENKRPVMASACEDGCPWGELGDYVQEAMEPYGYSVILCRNCNRWHGPRLVANGDYPPPLDEGNIRGGLGYRIDAPVDFGVTSTAMLYTAYNGQLNGTGPFKNLRLIAKIEDPYYFLVATKEDSGIRDFETIREQQLPVRIMGGRMLETVLNYYGISGSDIESWGGEMDISLETALDGDFDIVSGFLASPALNPESDWWTTLSQKYDLYFFEFPDELLDQIVEQNVDAERVTAHHSLLRGIERRIQTAGRSGESVFARVDTPDQAAYDLAKAIDENHAALKWFIRVYTYDPNTVWQNFGVPLHPGAERYYREAGYLRE